MKKGRIAIGAVLLIGAAGLAAFVLWGRSKPAVKENIPPEMQKLAAENEVEWMAGMWAELTNCTRADEDIAENIDSYLYTEDAVTADVRVQNGIEAVQLYSLMLLADGVPVEFSIDGNTYLRYDFELEQMTEMELEFLPEFSLHLGRLDFLLFYDGNPQGDYHMMSCTVWMEQKEEAEPADGLRETVSQRAGIRGSVEGNTSGLWLWNEDAVLSDETAAMRVWELEAGADEKITMELVVGRAGQYRTLVFADGKPLVWEGNTAVMEWESTGKNMLEETLQLPMTEKESYSIYAVSIPLELDSITVQCIASPKTELKQKLEN